MASNTSWSWVKGSEQLETSRNTLWDFGLGSWAAYKMPKFQPLSFRPTLSNPSAPSLTPHQIPCPKTRPGRVAVVRAPKEQHQVGDRNPGPNQGLNRLHETMDFLDGTGWYWFLVYVSVVGEIWWMLNMRWVGVLHGLLVSYWNVIVYIYIHTYISIYYWYRIYIYIHINTLKYMPFYYSSAHGKRVVSCLRSCPRSGWSLTMGEHVGKWHGKNRRWCNRKQPQVATDTMVIDFWDLR